ncbi:MAG TPA: hypothetical protein VEI06_04010 [Gemmatimonadaceae bacterium]|nr:hypothetical protein [Gemmatimonadaceae bacterium]
MSDRAIILAHGELAAGLVSAVEQITGRGDRFIALSNAGLGSSEIAARLEALVEETGVRVIFTDLPAGSCNFAAARLMRALPDLIVVSGVNLPTLLHFATHDGPSLADDVAEAVARGAPALRVATGASRGS